MGRVDGCQVVLDSAEAGRIELVISALTIAEVLLLRNQRAIPKERAQLVRDFFRRNYFVVVDVDRFIAERAQDLVWDYGIKPKDAVHVATALDQRVPILDTYDEWLLGKSLAVGGTPPLVICKPGDGMQSDLGI